jgi:hypothetical protein
MLLVLEKFLKVLLLRLKMMELTQFQKIGVEEKSSGEEEYCSR